MQLAKDHGGLSVRSFEYINIALLCKWWWSFVIEHDSLWQKHLVEKYDGDTDEYVTYELYRKFASNWG